MVKDVTDKSTGNLPLNDQPREARAISVSMTLAEYELLEPLLTALRIIKDKNHD